MTYSSRDPDKPVKGFMRSHRKGNAHTGGTEMRAREIYKRAPYLSARKLAKESGVSIAKAKEIIGGH